MSEKKSMKKRVRERAIRRGEDMKKRPSSEELDYLSDEDWAFITDELWPSKTEPYVLLMATHRRERSYAVDVRKFMGTNRLPKTVAFREYKKRELKEMPSKNLRDILDTHFSGCDIFGIKNMAARYGEEVENFRIMVKKSKNTCSPAPIVLFDEDDELCSGCKNWDKCSSDMAKENYCVNNSPRPWAANQDKLDRWFIEAEKRRRDGKERSDGNRIVWVK